MRVFVIKRDFVEIIHDGIKSWLSERLGDPQLEAKGIECLEILERQKDHVFTQFEHARMRQVLQEATIIT
jgi:hypothetical protein